MDKKIKWLLTLGSIFIIASACNLFSIGLNQVDDVISEIEDITDQIPVDEIMDEIDTLATDLPVDLEDIEEEIDALVTDIPSSLDDLGDIGDIGDLGDIGDAFSDLLEDGPFSGEAPDDIPIVDDPREILIESEDVISYLTSQDFSFIKPFTWNRCP